MFNTWFLLFYVRQHQQYILRKSVKKNNDIDADVNYAHNVTLITEFQLARV